MNDEWRSWTSKDPDSIAGPERGHMIYRADDRIYIFCSHPNPVLGKFTKDDLFFFTSSKGVASWDHGWRDHLFQEGRLFVQTNIDLGMSIEPESRAKQRKSQEWKERRLSLDSLSVKLIEKYCSEDVELLRRNKFADRLSHFCFTSSYPKAS
jgi:hypothetical protein